MKRTAAILGVLAAGAAAASACVTIDLDFYVVGTTGTGDAGTGDAGTADAGSVCAPGTTQACYSGPTGTEGHGICKAGTQTCAADGESWGPCVGEVLPATENCATPEDDDCDDFSPECTGTHVWSRRFGDTGSQLGNAIAVDANGNVVVAGQFSGTLDFGGGVSLTSGTGGAAFVAKLDPTGVVVWAHRFGGSAAHAVAVDGSGNVVVSGDFFGAIDFGDGSAAQASAGLSDVFVAKLDPSGAVLWGARFGGSGNDEGPAVAVDVSGNVVLVGSTNGPLDFGGGSLPAGGGTDLFVAKLEGAGHHVWSKRFGDATAQAGRAVAVGGAGEIVLAGQALGSLDFGCGAMPDVGGGDVVIAKLDPAGSCVWSKRFGDADVQDAAAVAIDAAGAVALVGVFHGSVDFGTGSLTSAGGKDLFVAKLDATGGAVWARGFGDTADQVGQAVALDGAANVVVTGYFGGSMSFGGTTLTSTDFYDVFLAKLDANTGAHLWSKRFGDAQEQAAMGVATDGAGNTLLTGYFWGTIDFGGNTLKSSGEADLFVAKLTE